MPADKLDSGGTAVILIFKEIIKSGDFSKLGQTGSNNHERLESRFKLGGNLAIQRDLESLLRDRPLLRFGVVSEGWCGLRFNSVGRDLIWWH
jgi:hypothetical protein